MTDYAAQALARRADTHLSCHRLNVALSVQPPVQSWTGLAEPAGTRHAGAGRATFQDANIQRRPNIKAAEPPISPKTAR